MTVVRAVGVSKSWGPGAGIAAIDLSVDSGEVVAVRGRSGMGKSTLLAMIAGWCRPDAGTVEIDGRPPSVVEPWGRIALVPQVLCLATELTVRENVADVNPNASRTAVDDGLTSLGLDALAARMVADVSAGQQQRVAVARAIVAHPDVLLADEPTSFQDGDHVRMVNTALTACATAGAAVIVATHDPDVVAAADRVVDLGGVAGPGRVAGR